VIEKVIIIGEIVTINKIMKIFLIDCSLIHLSLISLLRISTIISTLLLYLLIILMATNHSNNCKIIIDFKQIRPILSVKKYIAPSSEYYSEKEEISLHSFMTQNQFSTKISIISNYL
jgi:hypothetical protein